jgi:hypothetical protein
MELIYSSGRQGKKVRFVLWFLYACAAASVYYGFVTLQTYGLSPGDGGMLASFSARLSRGSFLWGLGLAIALATYVYSRMYINRIEIDGAHQNLLIETPTLIGARRQDVAVSQVRSVKFHRGSLYTIKTSVDAPWYTVKVEGRRLPFLLDAQGHSPDEELLERVLSSKEMTLDYEPQA